MALGGEPVEHVGAGRVRPRLALLAAVDAHFVEQYLAELLGRADRERVAGELVDLALEHVDASGEVVGQVGEQLAVDRDAGAFHVDQHRDQRSLDRFVDRHHALGEQPGLERLVQPAGDVGILGGIIERGIERHQIEGDLFLADAGDLLEGDRVDAEVEPRQLVHAVAVLAALEHIGNQHGVVARGDLDAVALEYGGVVFDVMADLEHRRVLEHRLQQCERLIQRDLGRSAAGLKPQGVALGWAVAERHVACRTGHHRE